MSRINGSAAPLIESLNETMTGHQIIAALEHLHFDETGHALTLLKLDREVVQFLLARLRRNHAAQVDR